MITGRIPLERSLETDRPVLRREVKLGQMLETLIERRGYSRNRKRILRALDISPAALSQYVREQTRPSFSKLVAIADFFEVSLDYLVYGRPTESSVDYGPLYRYVDHALANVQSSGRRHSAIVSRIGRVLADRIDEVAAELAANPTASREGLLQDDEMLVIEGYCRRADILSLNFEFEVIEVEGEIAGGRFLPVVAANLGRGTTYRFLVAGSDQDWPATVAACRRLLGARVGGDRVQENCQFRHTAAPVITGAGLYQLDTSRLETGQPALHAQIGDYLADKEWLGCTIRPNEDSNSDMLMDALHANRARIAFDNLWTSAAPL